MTEQVEYPVKEVSGRLEELTNQRVSTTLNLGKIKEVLQEICNRLGLDGDINIPRKEDNNSIVGVLGFIEGQNMIQSMLTQDINHLVNKLDEL